MPEGDPVHSSAPGRGRRWWRLAPIPVVLVLLLAAVAAYRFDLGARWFGNGRPSPVTQPALVLPPPGLRLPAVPRPAPVAAPRPAEAVDPAAVRRAVAGLVASKKLGGHVVVRVAALPADRLVYRHGSGTVAPASTMKLLTTTSALQVLGPQHRFATTVVATRTGRIVLVGGGDPLLTGAPPPAGTYPAQADLDTLARSTAHYLRRHGHSRIRLGYDTSLFSGPSVNPHWPASYLTEDVVSRISPLWVDEGRKVRGLAERNPAPAAAAAQVFARALERHHVQVVGAPASAVAPSTSHGGHRLAVVRSAPLAEIVQHIVEVSDNEGAEVLARHVAAASGRPASFAGAVRSIRSVLGGLGVDLSGDRFYDGSGLSRSDRLRPQTLVDVLATAASAHHPGLRSAVVNLPVAGFTGSLRSRYSTGSPAGPGSVRAKTGTLTGVHGLAGTVTTADGAVLAFAVVADRVKPVDTLDARAKLDEITAALAGCRCAKGSSTTP